MIHHITITIPIDPSQYADLGDSVEDAMLVANEILFQAADLPTCEEQRHPTILIAPSNEQIVQEMYDLLTHWSTSTGNDQLRAATRIVLQNLEQNRQLTKEAKEI